MAYDYLKYQKEYREKNIEHVSLNLHKINDADIIEAIGTKNKQAKVKELIRKALASEK